MSEFKYACPVCGQHIQCDSTQSGTTMECPTCFQKIVAPQAPATNDPKLIIKGTKAGERPVQTSIANANPVSASPPPPRKSFLGPVMVFFILFCVAALGMFVLQELIFKPIPPAKNHNSGKPQPGSDAVKTLSSSNDGNLALNRPAAASSQEDARGNLTQNGNDGDITTRWCAANGNVPQWWEVDLGGTTAIARTQISWEHNAGYQYVIEVSSDHTNWKIAADKTVNYITSQTASDDFLAKARYVRVVITRLQSGNWASFYEFQVFGPANDGGASNTSSNSARP